MNDKILRDDNELKMTLDQLAFVKLGKGLFSDVSIKEKIAFQDGTTVTRTVSPSISVNAIALCGANTLSSQFNLNRCPIKCRRDYLAILEDLASTGGKAALQQAGPFVGFDMISHLNGAIKLGQQTQYAISTMPDHHIMPEIDIRHGHLFVAQLTSFGEEVRRIEKEDAPNVENRLAVLRDYVTDRLECGERAVFGKTKPQIKDLMLVPLLRTFNGLYMPRLGDGLLRVEDGSLAWMCAGYKRVNNVITAIQRFVFKSGKIHSGILPPANAAKKGWPNPGITINRNL